MRLQMYRISRDTLQQCRRTPCSILTPCHHHNNSSSSSQPILNNDIRKLILPSSFTLRSKCSILFSCREQQEEVTQERFLPNSNNHHRHVPQAKCREVEERHREMAFLHPRQDGHRPLLKRHRSGLPRRSACNRPKEEARETKTRMMMISNQLRATANRTTLFPYHKPSKRSTSASDLSGT